MLQMFRSLSIVMTVVLALGCQEKKAPAPKATKKKSENLTPVVSENDKSALALETKREQAKADIRALLTALKMHKISEGFYPKTLDVLVTKGSRGKGPWISELTKDPWGLDYHYEHKNGHLHVVSYGQDGKPGGVHENADVDPSPPSSKSDSQGKKTVK